MINVVDIVTGIVWRGLGRELWVGLWELARGEGGWDWGWNQLEGTVVVEFIMVIYGPLMKEGIWVKI